MTASQRRGSLIVNVVDEYIAGFPADIQDVLRRVRACIRAAAPQAEERLAYGMPTFRTMGTSPARPGRNLVHFAARKHHLGLYPVGEAVGVFADELTAYHTSKGAIQFPWDEPIPDDVITRITTWRVEQERARLAGGRPG